MKQIAILGSGGFIGSHLVDAILKGTSWNCVGIDTDSSKLKDIGTNERFRFIKSDIYSLDILDEIIESSDTVVSLAAICNPAFYNTEPIRVIESNYDNPANIIKKCARFRKKLVHFSTSEVYGKTAVALGLPKDGKNHVLKERETHLVLGSVDKQRWSYACAKQLLERLIFAYGEERGLDYTIIRPFNFIGERMDYIPGVDGDGIPRVMACFMDSLMMNKPLKVVDGGKNQRVFTDIEDAIDAVLRIIDRPRETNRKVLNIGNPENELSIIELAERMISYYEEVAGKKPGNNCEITYVTSEEFYGRGYDDSDRRIPDISEAEKLLGWRPKFGLEETLKRTMKGFVAYYSGVC